MLEQGDVDMLRDGDRRLQEGPGHARRSSSTSGEPFAPARGWCRRTSPRRCRRSAEKGADGFYKGPVGAAIVAASKAGKGIITQADLDQYKTRELRRSSATTAATASSPRRRRARAG